MSNDFEVIEKAIASAARTAFTEVLKAHPEETFFAFVLSTLDDAGYVSASVNSLENHQSLVDDKGLEVPSPDDEYYRWTPCEWGDYEYVGSTENFDQVADLLQAKYDKMAEVNFAAYGKGVLDSMQGALATLDSEEFWGTGADRERVTLFVTVYDSESTEKVEDQSAKALNPPSTYAQFRKRFAETERKNRESEQEKNVLQARVASLPVEARAQYWITQLQQFVNDPPSDPIQQMLATETPLESLTDLGEPAVVPMLDFVEESMENDKPHVASLLVNVLQAISAAGQADANVHSQLARMLERSCRNNEGRKLWQITPFHIANCLYRLFEGYPMPGMEGNSALRDYQHFIELSKSLPD